MLPDGVASVRQRKTAHEVRSVLSSPHKHYFVTRKTALLLSVLFGVVTVTKPVVAPVGTAVLISVLETTLKVAAVPLKLTLVALLRLFPRMRTVAPTSPEVGSLSTNRPSPTTFMR
jgi:hypothetical protein